MSHYNSVVIGAGLSGLACAITLQKQGVRVLVVEAGADVGGRVKTRVTSEGFVLDEGFQVLLSSYPELDYFFDVLELDLKKFASGARVFTGEKLELFANPLVHPRTILSSLTQTPPTFRDKLLVLKLVWEAQKFSDDSVRLNQTTQQFLTEYGFSQEFIRLFWQPFLVGIFLDRELKVDAGYFLFLIKCFCGGQVTLPSGGMNRLPLLMSQKLQRGTVRLNQPVKMWSSRHVELVSGEILEADNVICAFDPAPRNDKMEAVSYQSVTTYYFTSPNLSQTGWGSWLVLIPRHLGFSFDHMTILTETAPGYSASTPLLSVSVIGESGASESQIAKEIEQIAKIPLNLRFIEKIEVAKALPVSNPNARGFSDIEGVIYCGDRWTSASINGALRSGRLAAEEVLRRNLKKPM